MLKKLRKNLRLFLSIKLYCKLQQLLMECKQLKKRDADHEKWFNNLNLCI